MNTSAKVIVQGNQVFCCTARKSLIPELPTLIFIHGALHDHSVWPSPCHYFAEHGYAMLIEQPDAVPSALIGFTSSP